MTTDPEPDARTAPPAPSTEPEPEPFVYPTIGTERVLEKGGKRSPLDEGESGPDHSQDS